VFGFIITQGPPGGNDRYIPDIVNTLENKYCFQVTGGCPSARKSARVDYQYKTKPQSGFLRPSAAEFKRINFDSFELFLL